MSGTINIPTSEDAARRELVDVVHKLTREARSERHWLAGDLGAVLNHVMFFGRASVPHRRPMRRPGGR
jgi:hypothetical protein